MDECVGVGYIAADYSSERVTIPEKTEIDITKRLFRHKRYLRETLEDIQVYLNDKQPPNYTLTRQSVDDLMEILTPEQGDSTDKYHALQYQTDCGIAYILMFLNLDRYEQQFKQVVQWLYDSGRIVSLCKYLYVTDKVYYEALTKKLLLELSLICQNNK